MRLFIPFTPSASIEKGKTSCELLSFFSLQRFSGSTAAACSATSTCATTSDMFAQRGSRPNLGGMQKSVGEIDFSDSASAGSFSPDCACDAAGVR